MTITTQMVLSLSFVAGLMLQAELFADDKKKDKDDGEKREC
jgi:hypothetical protein